MSITSNLTQPLTRAITQAGAGGGGAFVPDATFFAGRQGFAFDFQDPAKLSKDAAGTLPVTASQDMVYRVADLSGNGYHATVPSGTSRARYVTDARRLRRLEFFGTTGTPLQTAAVNFTGSSKLTIVYGIRRVDAVGTSQIAFESSGSVSLNNGSVASFFNVGAGVRIAARGTVVGAYDIATKAPAANVHVEVLDIAGATLADEMILTVDGTSPALVVGAAGPMGTGNFGNWPWYFGSNQASSSHFRGDLVRFAAIGGTVTPSELTSLIAWAKAGFQGPRIAVLGDSTTAENVGESLTAPAELVGGCHCETFSVSGNTVDQQKAAFVAAANGTGYEAIIIQVGLNDIKAGATSATVITRLQSLVDTVRSYMRPSGKLYIAAMNPGRGWFVAPTEYTAWQAVNEAIAGNGGTPITGVDARITDHNLTLDDGNGYLLAAYNNDLDGVHPNQAGRQVFADAWRAQLVADGLV